MAPDNNSCMLACPEEVSRKSMEVPFPPDLPNWPLIRNLLHQLQFADLKSEVSQYLSQGSKSDAMNAHVPNLKCHKNENPGTAKSPRKGNVSEEATEPRTAQEVAEALCSDNDLAKTELDIKKDTILDDHIIDVSCEVNSDDECDQIGPGTQLMKELAIVADDSVGFESNSRFDNFVSFLAMTCGAEERDIILSNVWPFILRLAVAAEGLKPFIGMAALTDSEAGRAQLSGDFSSALLALAFLSALPTKALNLSIHRLDMTKELSHLKIRSFINFFLIKLHGGGCQKILFQQEVLASSERLTMSHLASASQPILSVLVAEDISPEMETGMMKNMQLLITDGDFKSSRGLLHQETPIGCHFILNHLELALTPIITTRIEPEASVRIQYQYGNLNQRGISVSVINLEGWNDSLNEDAWDLDSALNSLFIGLRRETKQSGGPQSFLDAPAVSAVTSPASGTRSSQESPSSFSVSDSCCYHAGQNQESQSQMSYSVSDADRLENLPGKEKKTQKVKKRGSFAERLKASLARGETPDMESDDQAVQNQNESHQFNRRMRKSANMCRPVRRQRSTGFRGFSVNQLAESDEFFTATDDDQSTFLDRDKGLLIHPIKRPDSESFERSADNMTSSDAPPQSCSPTSNHGPSTTNKPSEQMVMRRRLVQDKSFDQSTSSAQMDSLSLEGELSPKTSTSSLFSESCSISSTGLGIPQLNDDCLEDLCEKLENCLELEQGGLKYRNLEISRTFQSFEKRALSETQIACIADLELAAHSTRIQINQMRRKAEDFDPEEENNLLRHAFSCPSVIPTSSGSYILNDCQDLGKEAKVMTVAPSESEVSRSAYWQVVDLKPSTHLEMLTVLLILAASMADLKHLVINTQGHSQLKDLGTLTSMLASRSIGVGELASLVVDFHNLRETNCKKEKSSSIIKYLLGKLAKSNDSNN